MSFIPYQIDYSVQNVSKTIGFSKKKILFKFGFASQLAVDNGSTGAACRGSEHELVFIWSLSSGKRQLYLDGKEVHYSESGQNGWTSDRAWQYVFPLRDTTLGVRNSFKAHFISQPVNRDVPDSRPFDLRIAGTSYFQFNHVYELGTPAMIVRGGPRTMIPNENDEGLSPEERKQIAQAKLESLRDMDQQNRQFLNLPTRSTAAPPATANLLEFDTPGQAPPPPQQQQAPPRPLPQPMLQAFASEITLDSAFDDGDRRQPPWMKQSPYPGATPMGGPGANQGYPAAAPPPSSQYPNGNYNPYAPAPPSNMYGTAPSPSPYGGPTYPVSAPSPGTQGYGPSMPNTNNNSTTTPNSNNALAVYQPPSTGQPAPSPYAIHSNVSVSSGYSASMGGGIGNAPVYSTPNPIYGGGNQGVPPTSNTLPMQQQQQQQQQQFPPSYYPHSHANTQPSTMSSPMGHGYNLPSPSAQSFQSFSSMGSIPAFAQPPQQPQTPQTPLAYGTTATTGGPPGTYSYHHPSPGGSPPRPTTGYY